MRVIEREHCFLLQGIFPEAITAGFTKPTLQGDSVRDTQTVLSFLPGERNVAHLKQIHSAILHKITDAGQYQGDGLFTEKNGIALVVRTADCLPLLFYSESIGVSGAVHMGWRGAKEGILNGITKILKISDLSTFKVIAGVGMRSCCYQVGTDFKDYPQFVDCLTARGEGVLFDPIKFAKRSLIRYGMREENFFDMGICSLCTQQKYFSHRRDKTTSRTLSFIIKTQ